MSKKLFVLGAYDRYNYGDILFAHIITKMLSPYYERIEFYGLVESDLTSVGGFITKSLRELNNCKENYDINLVVAGGESLTVSWGVLLTYISPFFYRLNLIWRILSKLFGASFPIKIKNYISKLYLGGKSELPFSVSNRDFSFVSKVFYNSLGGSALKKPPKYITKSVFENWRNVDYLSVRDNVTYDGLLKNNIKVKLVPDSAILMSKFYPKDVLAKNISEEVLEYLATEKSYCFFQVNKSYFAKHRDEIVSQLVLINNRLDIEICLCPIGFAYGHEDDWALRNISELLSIEHKFFETVSIWDIMYLIANSDIYVGTSLHGTITAMSFSKPYVGLEVIKLENYLNTWAPTPLKDITKIADICNSVEKNISFDRRVLLENCNKQMDLVLKSFEFMK